MKLLFLWAVANAFTDPEELFRAGRFAEAAAAYRSLLADDPGSVDALSGLGRSLLNSSHAADALPYLGRAVQLRPQDVRLKISLANALLAVGNVPAAIGLLEPLVTSDTTDAEAPLLLGEAMYRGGYYQRSLQLLEQGLALQPDNSGAKRMLAVSLAKVGRNEEAAAACERILKDRTKPADLDVLLTYVELLAESGRFAEAMPHADRAVQEQPANPIAHFWKARLLLQTGRMEAAAGEAEKSVALAPNLPFARNLLVQIYRKLGRIAEAKTQAEWLRQYSESASGRGRL
jgi:tetratricopeptide (TPR) repeat protein